MADSGMMTTPWSGVIGEGILPLLVRGAAELEDLHGPPALLLLQDVAQDDDVVGDELLDAVARDRRRTPRCRSAVIRAVTPMLLEGGGDAEQFVADRRLSLNWVKMPPSESSAMRWAPILRTACSMRASRPPRS